MFVRWLWMAGHPCTVPVSGITPEWLLSYCSMMQISTPKQKASWPPYILLLGTETAKIPSNSSWWTATSKQVWRTTWRKLHLTSPGGQASITTSLKLWKAAQILHLSLNGSNNFLKFLSPSASFSVRCEMSPSYKVDIKSLNDSNSVVLTIISFQVNCLTLMSKCIWKLIGYIFNDFRGVCDFYQIILT